MTTGAIQTGRSSAVGKISVATEVILKEFAEQGYPIHTGVAGNVSAEMGTGPSRFGHPHLKGNCENELLC